MGQQLVQQQKMQHICLIQKETRTYWHIRLWVSHDLKEIFLLSVFTEGNYYIIKLSHAKCNFQVTLVIRLHFLNRITK